MLVSFPLRIGDRRIPDPPALAQAVREDAAAGGGQLLAGERPRDWVMGLVATKVIERDLAIALVAALLQDPTATTLVECTHLARALGGHDLGAVLSSASEAHDVGVLLVAAPGEDNRSVEDVLLLAATALVDATDDVLRRALLERLRNAGLSTAELQLLARGGSPEDVRTWLPSILLEGGADPAAIAELLSRKDTREASIRVLMELDEDVRRTLWTAARAVDRRIRADVKLRTRLFAKYGIAKSQTADSL